MIYLNNISEANSEIRDDSLSLNFDLQTYNTMTPKP